jgi:ribosomal protein S18 acetylase RimI-like enzyme
VNIPGYSLRTGTSLDRALVVKFMAKTYHELYPDQDLSHLARTVEQYFSSKTPLWWVDNASEKQNNPIAGLWLGNAIDQVTGNRISHIFLLYVAPQHRHQGIGRYLMQQAESWAQQRGDKHIGLQVFVQNEPALNLYRKLGYTTQSLWMLKPLPAKET